MKYDTHDLKTLTTIRAAVIVPLLQAGITAVFIGTLGGTVAMLAGASFWKWALLSGAASGLLAWWAALASWRDAVYQAKQEPPQEYQAQTRLKLSIDWDEGRSGLFDELGISDELFVAWAIGAANGKSLGENHWTGASNPFSKGQYHNFIDRMFYLGLVKSAGKGKSSGFELTGKGRAVCREIQARYGGDPSPADVKYLPSWD